MLDELRRRNVIRMAGLYLVGSWLITQIAGTLLPVSIPAEISPALTAIVLGLSAGFAFAMTSPWLGLVAGVGYAAVGVSLWAAAVRKVGRWHRDQRDAARRLASYLGEDLSSRAG